MQSYRHKASYGRFGSLADLFTNFSLTSAFGRKADVPTFVILRDLARFRPVSARNSQIVFGAFGRRKFVYVVST